MTAQEWIEQFAQELGSSAPSEQEWEELLTLAGVAAHSSERIAAPIACWLVGKTGLDSKTALAKARTVTESK